MTSNTVSRKYIKAEGAGGVNCLKIEVYYSLGGMNYFTYKVEPRGYYLSVTPLERKGNWETYVGFSGVKKLVKEVARKSAKAADQAVELAKSQEQSLIDYVCAKEHIAVIE